MSEPFILDRVENPHPVMRDRALNLRRIAALGGGSVETFMQWQGYLWCMSDATGLDAEEINAWLDKYDDVDTDALSHKEATPPPALSQRVEIKRR